MPLSLALIIIGLVIGVLLNWTLGVLLVLIGAILLIVPAYSGRRYP